MLSTQESAEPLELIDLWPAAVTLVVAIVGLYGLSRLLGLSKSSSNRDFRRHLTLLLLTVVGTLLVIFMSPEGIRSQLLQLFGVVLSATIALASTSFLGNALAGIQLRVVGAFKAGDFLRVGDQFGRITERGLFHTEIQNEDRDLTTLPNLFVVSNPYKVIRASGTIISGSVSLGYDVPRTTAEAHLLEAARHVGLVDPFVKVDELGDFSITYRVAGMLTEVKTILTSRSNLRKAMLDALHENRIEIVSPTFMTTRGLASDAHVVPERPRRETAPSNPAPEKLMFDKADEAASLAKIQANIDRADADLADCRARLKACTDDESKAGLEAELSELTNKRETLVHNQAVVEARIEDEES